MVNCGAYFPFRKAKFLHVIIVLRDMVLSEESERILVRKDTIARCSWCGSPESNKWVSGQNDEIYCTPECWQAASMGKRKIAAGARICLALAMILFPTIAILTSNLSLAAAGMQFGLTGFLILLLGLAMYLGANEGKKYQDRKGKYSGISPIECEYCMHSNPPRATRCLNCDAPLTGAPFLSEAIPPWISKQSKVKGVRCPFCNAIYSYLPSVISDDGQVNCQNCTRQFLVPIGSKDTSTDLHRAYY